MSYTCAICLIFRHFLLHHSLKFLSLLYKLTALSRQYSINFIKLSPVTTPGGTISMRPIVKTAKENRFKYLVKKQLRQAPKFKGFKVHLWALPLFTWVMNDAIFTCYFLNLENRPFSRKVLNVNLSKPF